MTGQVKVEGGARLRRTMRQAGVDLTQLKDLHLRVARIVGIAAQFGAPIGDTGRLKSSVRVSGTNSAAIIRAGFASVPYAPPIHWGWQRRGISANPWISAAAQNTESTWFDAYTSGVDQVLSQIEGA